MWSPIFMHAAGKLVPDPFAQSQFKAGERLARGQGQQIIRKVGINISMPNGVVGSADGIGKYNGKIEREHIAMKVL